MDYLKIEGGKISGLRTDDGSDARDTQDPSQVWGTDSSTFLPEGSSHNK